MKNTRVVAIMSTAVALSALTAPRAARPRISRPDIDAKAQALLRQMTLDEKIGQMTQVDMLALKDKADIARYAFGSMLSGGDSDPSDNTPKAWAAAYDDYQSWARPRVAAEDSTDLWHRRPCSTRSTT